MPLTFVKEACDLLIRCVFFATAPFMLVFVALLFPVTGAVVQIALALVVFVAGEAIRRTAGRWPVVHSLLATQFEFEAFYRDHPPRPFVYYVFYPLLAPYWLTVRSARREFLLYKGYTLISFGILLVSLFGQYYWSFPPELTWSDFAPIAAGTLAVEAAVVLMFLMPIVTSVVHFHQRHSTGRLAILLVAGMISIGFAATRLERRRDPIVSYATRVRLRLRTEAQPEAGFQAQADAIGVAWRALPNHFDAIERDGKVLETPLVAARDELAKFYKLDEANAFDLWYSNQDEKKILVLYFESHRGRAPIWIAIDELGSVISDEKQLPVNAFKAMRRAAR
ncbi:MAG TPA: hypothetical protein VFG30_33360 [Polyangiales bacterium]|nr:hypothetical protein [Polyangiales bacterium]